MDSESRIYVAGNTGLVGSAIVRSLLNRGYKNIISSPSSHWDLRRQDEVERFFRLNKPEYVFLSAARVGGIMDNKTYPGEFIYDNLMIQNNVIHCSKEFGVKKLLFLGSSCIYPKMATQPITEDQLMTGPLEPTNDAYALAKITGIKMCQAYREQYGFNAIALMPTNLYGPNDNFNPISSHVLPGFIAKFHAAKINNEPVVNCWGDGSPYREFLHVDDLADASIFCMKNYDNSDIINVGTGEDITIRELAEKISSIVGYKGKIEWDTNKPNGTPRKLLNVDKLKDIGWSYKIKLDEGIQNTYKWYLEEYSK
jgi:GDP-L-fucose synthase